MVSPQGGLSEKRMRKVVLKENLVSPQGGLSSRWSLLRVVSLQGGLSSRWSLLKVVSHLDGISSGWSLITDGLSSPIPLGKLPCQTFFRSVAVSV